MRGWSVGAERDAAAHAPHPTLLHPRASSSGARTFACSHPHLVARGRARARRVVGRPRLLHACASGVRYGGSSGKRSASFFLRESPGLARTGTCASLGRTRWRWFSCVCFRADTKRNKQTKKLGLSQKRKPKKYKRAAGVRWTKVRARRRAAGWPAMTRTAARTPRARPSSPCAPWPPRPSRRWRWRRRWARLLLWRRRRRRPAHPRRARPARAQTLTGRHQGRARPATRAAGRRAARR